MSKMLRKRQVVQMLPQSLLLYLLVAAQPAVAHSIERSGRPLVNRQVASGGKCGTANGNAVCAAGLCCSLAGVCGTGGAFCSAPDCQLSFGPACDGNQAPTSGPDTSNTPRPQLGSVPYGVSIAHCTVPGKVALTFDDGPYIYTSELLDTLVKNSVKATFFIVGNNAAKGQIQNTASGWKPVIQRMLSDGHQIGSHSWSHADMSVITAEQRKQQIIRNEIALSDILGFFPTYFRPPYTSCNADCTKDLGALGYHIANYDIDTKDFLGDYNFARNTYSSILTQNSPSSSSWISLAHDVHPETVHTFAQFMIDQARKLNYTLTTLGDCMGDPVANWYRDPKTGQAFQPQNVASSSSAAAPAPTSTSTTAAPAGTSLNPIGVPAAPLSTTASVAAPATTSAVPAPPATSLLTSISSPTPSPTTRSSTPSPTTSNTTTALASKSTSSGTGAGSSAVSSSAASAASASATASSSSPSNSTGGSSSANSSGAQSVVTSTSFAGVTPSTTGSSASTTSSPAQVQKSSAATQESVLGLFVVFFMLFWAV